MTSQTCLTLGAGPFSRGLRQAGSFAAASRSLWRYPDITLDLDDGVVNLLGGGCGTTEGSAGLSGERELGEIVSQDYSAGQEKTR